MNSALPIATLESRMRPGAWSEEGFLGKDESLADVLAHDAQLLANAGITHEQVAAALEAVLALAMKKQEQLLDAASGPDSEYFRREEASWPESDRRLPPGALPSLDGGYLVGRHQVFWRQYRGPQDCPWSCGYKSMAWSSFDFLILNRDTGLPFTGPALGVHLIREHHFFEGVGTRYRIDPLLACKVLGLCE